MAAVEVTITGVLYDKLNRTTQQVVLIGEASLTGLQVGGGPMPPGSGGQPPLGIWGPTDPRPSHPITGLPGYGPPIGQPPHPAHPIVLPPDPPVDPPVDPPTNPPSDNWVWGYSPALPGWTPVYVPGPNDPQPHA